MQIEPYLFFDGRCEEAIEFYRRVAGAQVEMMMRYGQSPEKTDPSMLPPGSENKIMHASLRIGNSRVLASDGHCANQAKFQGFALALTVADESAAEKSFAALSEGGKVQMPLTKTFFSPKFGMLLDRFGMSWMIMVSPS
jgi:PhnB protein